MAERTCITPDCGGVTGMPGTAREMCSKCYNRWRRHGDVVTVKKGSPGKGPAHHSWKGDEASYTALHNRVYRARGKADHCERCGADDPAEKYEWAMIHGTDGTNVNDYISLCASCHRTYDIGKTTAEQREEIRDRAAAGESLKDLALEFGINPVTVSHGPSPKYRKWRSLE